MPSCDEVEHEVVETITKDIVLSAETIVGALESTVGLAFELCFVHCLCLDYVATEGVRVLCSFIV